MIDIEKLKEEIVERLKPLEPDRIILFGSYAYGKPTEESDVDLLIVKNIPKENTRDLSLKAKKRLREIVLREKISMDIFADSFDRITKRIVEMHDQFYSEIIEKGQTIYGK